MKKASFFLIVLVSIVSSCKNKHLGLDQGLYAKVYTEKGDLLIRLYHEDTPLIGRRIEQGRGGLFER
jgi:hypothetical protein